MSFIEKSSLCFSKSLDPHWKEQIGFSEEADLSTSNEDPGLALLLCLSSSGAMTNDLGAEPAAKGTKLIHVEAQPRKGHIKLVPPNQRCRVTRMTEMGNESQSNAFSKQLNYYPSLNNENARIPRKEEQIYPF